MNVMSRISATKPKSVDQFNLKTPPLERRRLRAYAVLMLLDSACLIGSAALAGLLYEGAWWPGNSMLAGEAILPIFLTVGLYNQTYSGNALADWVFGAKKVLVALLVSAALLSFVAFYTKTTAQFSRASVTLGIAIAAVLMVGLRRLVPLFVARFWNGRTVNRLVIWDGGPEFSHPKADRVRAQDMRLEPASDDPFMFDRFGRIVRHCDKVIVSCSQDRREAWALLLKSTGIYGEIVSQPLDLLGATAINRYPNQGCETLVVSTGPLSLRSRVSKRIFDLVVAALGLVVLTPLFLVIGLLIKLEDRGPVLFVQRRLGRGNQFFNMLKFRSMNVAAGDASGGCSARRHDGRTTHIGAFIRRNSIDELPQLINVLRGEMSIVGPRPHALGSRANSKLFWEVAPQYWHRHCLKPGLTGLAQVRGFRGTTECEQDLTGRLQSDLEYISDWSLSRDFEIALRTLRVLRHDRAY